MASACVNNSVGVSPPSYAWLTPSPGLSFSRDDDPSSKKSSPSSSAAAAEEDELDGSDPVEFEFRLEDPVTMLPADELFSDGKLVPLHLFTLKSSSAVRSAADELAKSCDMSGVDPYLFSPKAPRCSSRWRELLGFKKLYQNTKSEHTHLKTTSPPSSTSSIPAKSSLKHFLHRSTKSSSSSSSLSSYYSLESSLSLLRDSDSESVSISSSRFSLSSSSSGHQHEDLSRRSLDSDKPIVNPNPNPFANPPRMRMVKAREGTSHNQTSGTSRVGRSPMRRDTSMSSSSATSRGVSVDSPRMNSSGKIVFQSLERSSSSPSSFNGGPRFKHRGGMERSYSANVRVTPVLNVPVGSFRGSSKSGSVFGFGQLFSQKYGLHHHGSRQQQQQQQSINSRNRTDRT